eukprot:CAMPEP_0173346014 /NCGR_PEP_ID=MMETSP1144-20121109/12329_1 /TAXON_ID=483371 /ORGANISM="non described non described, Strain CCMP2298" /LENGTH=110 /DNA_ID=CAMNT_0014293275 /DNA_START=761 /DNA_END=1094 /DNA_ORIENTATION=+
MCSFPASAARKQASVSQGQGGSCALATAAPRDALSPQQVYKQLNPRDKEGPALAATAECTDSHPPQLSNKKQYPMGREELGLAATAPLPSDPPPQHTHKHFPMDREAPGL